MVLLVEEYFELTTKYKAIYGENTIVLMQVGAFFEVYGTKKIQLLVPSTTSLESAI